MATRFSNESTGEHTGSLGASQAKTRHRRGRLQSRNLRRLLLAATVVSLIIPQTGCMMINGVQRAFSRHDSLDEFMVNYRNRAWAARAWLCSKDKFANHCYLSDLEAGFRQGYEDVAAGGSGCLPTVCPRSYWGWQYQSADGQARMNAWFEGYPLGVQAAEQDGVGHWGNVAAAFPSQQPAPAPAAVPPAPMPAELEGLTDGGVVVEELAPPVPTGVENALPPTEQLPALSMPPAGVMPVDPTAPLQLP
jgi:hypothetical protein